MRVVSTHRWDEPAKASRPFNMDRDGFVLGEGSWMFVLEDYDHAKARGAKILAEIAGYASTCDAYHRVQISPDVIEPVRAMQLAIKDAGVGPEDIGYINLHGTSTQLNDKMGDRRGQPVFWQTRGENFLQFHEVNDRPSAGRVRCRGFSGDDFNTERRSRASDDQFRIARSGV